MQKMPGSTPTSYETTATMASVREEGREGGRIEREGDERDSVCVCVCVCV